MLIEFVLLGIKTALFLVKKYRKVSRSSEGEPDRMHMTIILIINKIQLEEDSML